MKLVFDIGANIGNTVEQFTLINSKVICFEPNPTLASELRGRFENSSVVVDERAVSDKNGTQIFKISNANTISTLSEDWITNSRFTESYTWDTHVQVETVTLDSIVEQYGEPDYIKIDVEGHEFEVLTSFTKLLPNTLLSFEWAEEQKSKIESTIHYLNKLGYNMFGYTEFDKILFDNEIDWKEYKNFDLIESLIPERKEKWGMIYIKK
jgi:FkbM family methyltransferase